MAVKMTTALAALAEKIFVQAVAQVIAEGMASLSYEDLAKQAHAASAAYLETSQALTR